MKTVQFQCYNLYNLYNLYKINITHSQLAYIFYTSSILVPVTLVMVTLRKSSSRQQVSLPFI